MTGNRNANGLLPLTNGYTQHHNSSHHTTHGENHPKKLDDVLSMSRSPLGDVTVLHVHSGGGIQPRVQPRLHDSECQQPRREA